MCLLPIYFQQRFDQPKQILSQTLTPSIGCDAVGLGPPGASAVWPN
jgi:hypothetical protein